MKLSTNKYFEGVQRFELESVGFAKPNCSCLFVYMIVFNATFNNISVISWLSVLLMEETGEPGENHRPVTSH
jgi:hypothetical protein